MANVKITQLPLATTPLTGTEVFPLVQGTTTKQVSITGLFTSPVMTNPTLGTVGQADLINATGLPISTGVAGLGTGIATFLGTPSSANLRAAVTDETGTGALVFATSPTLVTPDLGTPTAMVATNITGTALGLIAGSAITNANLTGAVTSVGNATSLGSFTSAQLRTALTDETGSGVAVFATSPTLVTPDLGTPSAGVLTNATGLPLTTGVTGTLGLGNGGTGQTTANAAFNALAPSQTGNSGKYLTTDGTNTSWATNPLGTVTSVDVSGGTTGLTTSGGPITTSGTITLAGTLATTNGGTGLTSFTSGGLVYASSTSALTTGSLLTFDGSRLGVGTSSPSTYGKLAVVGGNGTGSTIIASYGGTSAGDYGLLVLGTGTTAKASMNVDATSNNVRFDTRGNTGDFYWASGASYTEGMRLTSTGLGIGTSSPSYRLDAQVSSNVRIARFKNTSTTVQDYTLFTANDSDVVIGMGVYGSAAGTTGMIGASSPFLSTAATELNILANNASGVIKFATGGNTEKMRLDSSGNLGLGVTPSAWGSGTRGFNIGSGSAIWNPGSGNQTHILTNAYNDGTNYIYRNSSNASRYSMVGNAHQWFTASSGTAGNAITFTQAMTLDASGNLGVGVTSPGTKLDVNGTSFLRGDTGIYSSSGGAVNSSYLTFGSAALINAARVYSKTDSSTAGNLVFDTAQSGTGTLTERARIDSSGNFGLGASSMSLWGTASNPAIYIKGTNGSYPGRSGALVLASYDGLSNVAVANDSGSQALQFYIGTSEKMRLDASGNLGIGTSSPATKLDVANASGRAARIGGFQFGGTTSSADGGNNLLGSGVYWNGSNLTATQTSGAVMQLGNGVVQFQTLSGLTAGSTYSFSPQVTLDSAGNLGLGVTPSAWGSNFKAIQLGLAGSIASQTGAKTTEIANNAYNNSGWKYQASDVATLYYQYAGKHTWANAVSGTAGNAVTFTETMTLDSSGNLILNNAGGDANMYFGGSSGTNRMYLARSGVDSLLINVETTGALRFGTNGTERARFDSSGRLLVGITSVYNGSCTYQQRTAVDSNQVFSLSNSSTTTPYIAYFEYPNVTPNNTGSYFLQCNDATANRFQLRSNGGIANFSANDVNLSDRREKTNFAPAGNYLAKICAIPVQTFNYIDQNLEEDGGLTLGVVAQDVQAVAPELVMESNWAKSDEEPKMRLSIYQTDLQYALMKCIQEQQAIIESLKARLDAANL